VTLAAWHCDFMLYCMVDMGESIGPCDINCRVLNSLPCLLPGFGSAGREFGLIQLNNHTCSTGASPDMFHILSKSSLSGYLYSGSPGNRNDLSLCSNVQWLAL